jgi:predicted membrane protein
LKYLGQMKEANGSKRKKYWPWVVLLIVVFCGIYAYERISEFLEVNAEQLPFMFFDFIIEYFLGSPAAPDVTDI